MMKALMDYINAFFKIKNFWDLIEHRIKGSEVEIITRKGNNLKLPPLCPSDVFSLIKAEDMIKVNFPRAEVNYMNNILEFYIGLPDSLVVLYEVFKKQVYKTDVSGRVVIDVGGFIGDTAIYYYLNGADKVISVEAHPRNFEVLKRNLSANNIPFEKVKPIHAAVGSGNDVFIPLESEGGRTKVVESGENVIRVKGITIDELTSGYDDVLLKIDCEGCEFEALDYSSLENVSEIILEYHCGKIDCRASLASTLSKKGFSIVSVKLEKLSDGRFFGFMRAKKN